MDLPYSEACERNKDPILDVLRNVVRTGDQVLEVGSGTGQHVAYFARALGDSYWLPADTSEYLPGLRARLAREECGNIAAAIELDVRMNPWPVEQCDVLFSANTLHFMGEDCVQAFFSGVGSVLRTGGRLFVYGPFNYGGTYTSPSNARFDDWLKSTDPARGIRDFEWVASLAEDQGLRLLQDIKMPANNRLLLWHKATIS